MLLPRWSEEVRAVLAAAGVPESRLAAALGVQRSVVHRYFNGEHESKPETVQKVNAAVADLIGGPDLGEYLRIKDYLEAVEMANRAEHGSSLTMTDLETAMEATIDEVRILTRKSYLRADAEKTIFREICRRWSTVQGRRAMLKLFSALLLIGRARLMIYLIGKPPTATRVERVSAIFKRHGIDLNPYMREEDDLREARAEDEFDLGVARALAETGASPELRWRLARKISVAHGAVVSELLLSWRKSLKPLQRRKGKSTK